MFLLVQAELASPGGEDRVCISSCWCDSSALLLSNPDIEPYPSTAEIVAAEVNSQLCWRATILKPTL